MKNLLRKERAMSMQGLKKIARKVWRAITAKYLQKLYTMMPQRMQAICDAQYVAQNPPYLHLRPCRCYGGRGMLRKWLTENFSPLRHQNPSSGSQSNFIEGGGSGGKKVHCANLKNVSFYTFSATKNEARETGLCSKRSSWKVLSNHYNFDWQNIHKWS